MTRAHPETNYPCDCHSLDEMADEPDVPIVFDDETNEYRLEHKQGTKGYMALYYCPHCGGKLPDSRRHRFFARLTNSETKRLWNLTKDIVTIDDAFKILGHPDSDIPYGRANISRESETEPRRVTNYRMITYRNLSKTALVEITDYRKDRVEISFRGKDLETRETIGPDDNPVRTKDSPTLKDREEGRETVYCSFCNQSEHSVGRILRSRAAAICSGCAESWVHSSGS